MRIKLLKFIGIALFIWIIWKIDRTKMIEYMRDIDLKIYIAALFFQYLIYLTKSIRWHIFVLNAAINTTFKKSWKLYNLGFFFSSITPAKLGEFGKSAYLVSAGMPKAQAIGIVLLDRFMDVIVIALIAILGVGILFSWIIAAVLTAVVLLMLPTVFLIISYTQFL